MTTDEANALRAKAEIQIEKILIDLVNGTGRDLDMVNVDTRNFANCDCEIFFRSSQEE